MKTIWPGGHRQHAPAGEFNRGKLVAAFECPARAEAVRSALESAQPGSVREADSYPLERVTRVHDRSFVQFLAEAHGEWSRAGRNGDALPIAWPVRGFRSDRVPTSIDGRLSYYSFDGMTAITAGTWAAVRSAANAALTGADGIARGDSRAVFALCRPPGHHAGADCYGGYSYLNNAAIAAQYLRDEGAARVGILDIDYHHGNGTQSIFYSRSDVMFVSIHADPATDYPFFLGYGDETGTGEGSGFNRNYPLPRGTGWEAWSGAFSEACRRLRAYQPDAVVVSLGVDTFKGDPLAHFELESGDYSRIGGRIAGLKLPTLFVMEGGYAIGEIGTNVANVLSGYENA